MSDQFRDMMVLAGFVAVVGALALAAAVKGLTTPLEAVSFVTGAMCVWLTVKESIWNFPLGLANVATFCIVFFRARLFADAGLQVVYFLLGVSGWYMWLYGGKRRTRLEMGRASSRELLLLLACAVIGTLALWQLLHRWGGSATFWDALTTSLSLCSQWLLNRKRLESWLGWIVVDVIYIPLYASKELYLTALLYAVFLIMAVIGWRSWRNVLRLRGWTPTTSTQAGAVAP